MLVQSASTVELGGIPRRRGVKSGARKGSSTGSRWSGPHPAAGKAAVPLLVAVSAVLLAARISFDGDTYQDCDYLGPSLRMYVTACAAPAFAVAALLLFVVPARGVRSGGERLRGTAPGGLAAAFACVAPSGRTRLPVLDVRARPGRRHGMFSVRLARPVLMD
ncbi:MAG TPA: hypothetical protein VGO89_03195, partial [Streptomyces sp.]|nr:hypothetical protein [Streptomyces sp.]